MPIAKIKATKETLNNMKNMQAEVNRNIDKDITKKRKAAFKKICEYLNEVADSLDGEEIKVNIGKHGEIICCEDATIYFNSKYCTYRPSCTLENSEYSDSPIKWWIGGGYHAKKKDNNDWYNYIDSEINIDWDNHWSYRDTVHLIEGWKDKFKPQIEDGVVEELNKRMEKIRRDTTERVEQYEKVGGFMVKEMIIALVKPGDTVEITPISKRPNAERRFKVDYVLDDGFLFGSSTTCDGYVMPFAWIQDIKIVE